MKKESIEKFRNKILCATYNMEDIDDIDLLELQLMAHNIFQVNNYYQCQKALQKMNNETCEEFYYNVRRR